MELPSALLDPSSKNKKNPPQENFLKESFSYTSGNRNAEKIYYIFSKDSFFYIPGKKNSERILYVLGNETLFQEERSKPRKPKFIIFLQKNL